MDFIDNGEALYKKIDDLKKKNKLLQERFDETIKRCQQLESELQESNNFYSGYKGGVDTIVGDTFK